MTIGRPRLLLRGLLAVCILCISCAPRPPLPDATPGRISVVADTDSPYWKSWIDLYVPRSINDHARYAIVAPPSSDAPYKLHIRVVNTDSYMSGLAINAYGARINYRTRLEVETEMFDSANRSVWTWSGWAEYNSGEKSMKRIAKQLGQAMADRGLLAPSYYSPPSQAK